MAAVPGFHGEDYTDIVISLAKSEVGETKTEMDCYLRIGSLLLGSVKGQRVVGTTSRTDRWIDFLANDFRQKGKADVYGMKVSARRNGDLLVLEGQSRTTAGRRAFGYSYLFPYRVYFGLTEQEEARIIVQSHTSLPMTNQEKFSVLATAQMDLGVSDLLAREGVRVNAPQTAIRLVAAYGDGIFEQAVRIIRTGLGERQDNFSLPIMTAMCQLLHGNPHMRPDRMVAMISQVGLNNLKRRASGYRSDENRDSVACMRKALAFVYNYRLHEGSRVQ
jgi:hypothetical protein